MTFQLVICPLKGATSVAPGSAVCRTVAEIAIGPLGSALVSGLPSVTVVACAAEAPWSEGHGHPYGGDFQPDRQRKHQGAYRFISFTFIDWVFTPPPVGT